MREKNGIVFNYGSAVVTVPGAALDKIRSATRTDLAVLLCVLDDPAAEMRDLCLRCCCSEIDVSTALSFWRGAGIIASGDVTAPSRGMGDLRAGPAPAPAASAASAASSPADEAPADAAPERKKLADHELPVYSMEEVAAVASRPGVRQMVDICEQLMGKMFNTTEQTQLVSLLDYYGFDCEYMSILCAHLVKTGKKTVPALKREAERLYNEGVTDVSTLNAYVKAEEEMESLEDEVKVMFGIPETSRFNSVQREILRSWRGKLGYGADVIRLAADKTAEQTDADSPITSRMKYANTILDDWHRKGLQTCEDVLEAVRKDVSKDSGTVGKSFDTEDFFAAALRRSYGDADVPTVRKPEKKKK